MSMHVGSHVSSSPPSSAHKRTIRAFEAPLYQTTHTPATHQQLQPQILGLTAAVYLGLHWLLLLLAAWVLLLLMLLLRMRVQALQSLEQQELLLLLLVRWKRLRSS